VRTLAHITPPPMTAPIENVRISYSDFYNKLENNEITDVLIFPNTPDVLFEEKDGTRGTSSVFLDNDIVTNMRNHDINITFMKQRPKTYVEYCKGLLPYIIPIGIIAYIFGGNVPRTESTFSAGNPMDKNYDLQITQNTGITFEDVAGIDAEKGELIEIVDFLKNPTKYNDAGAKVPKGCLLTGPPGTGKTLLAKAIAGEAGVPFIACSASQFIEMFVGLGASRIRALFKTAREKSPCIIFIDEIDAIGKQRGGSMIGGGGNDEREQTLNQLLTEMDGFEENSGIIFLGATNRFDVIDPALLRPGRFDRKVTVNLPSYKERESILKVHARNKKFESVEFKDIAKLTTGFSGADLENLMNESAIIAARNERTIIENNDITEAYEKITIGLPSSKVYSEKIKERVAYHEAGHALIGILLKDFDKLGKITILPRGSAGGFTQFIPDDDIVDSGLMTRSYMEAKIAVALGGRVAEEYIYGQGKTSVGASSDMKSVNKIAHEMVCNYGFSSVGPITIDNNASDELKAKVDYEIDVIVTRCYTFVQDMIEEYGKELEQIKEKLMENETITSEDIDISIKHANTYTVY
tara:strand:+ start:469 stop:2211 length:1743 start_codon:yes stop_codon:yes gene_type:complete